MTIASQKILDDALALSDEERLELAAQLIASVDGPPDADWEEAWQAEIDRRIAAADRDGVTGSDWVEVRGRILERLGRR